MKETRLPTYYLSHGGGPWPWLKKEMPFTDELEKSLVEIPKYLGKKPKAVLVISGHWEEEEFAVMSSPKPPMVYDYSGFPEFTYHIQYPAPGAPELASKVATLLSGAGFNTHLDDQIGFDHGTFSMLYPMYPEADVPVFQLSLKKSYDPQTHFLAGKALAPLRDEGVLIIGSGLSYHNLRFPSDAKEHSAAFDSWLQDALLNHTGEERKSILNNWESAPYAREVHPREDHLIPLMVALGAAENENASIIYHEFFMNRFSASSFRFG